MLMNPDKNVYPDTGIIFAFCRRFSWGRY